MPTHIHTVAMALLGAFVGGSITLASATQILAHAPLLIGLVLLMVAGTTLLSLALVRWGTLPGSTAVWGVSPGAGLVMVVLAKTYGADASLVGLMQYLRVALAALLAGLIARFWFDPLSRLRQRRVGSAPSTRPHWQWQWQPSGALWPAGCACLPASC